MDRSIILHADLEPAVKKHRLDLEIIKTILKKIPWEGERGSDRFSCGDDRILLQCRSEAQEVFIENLFLHTSSEPIFLLFDIDGTLLSSAGAGKQAIQDALIDLFGTAGEIDGYAFSGKLDHLIVRELIGRAGVKPEVIESRLTACMDRYFYYLRENLKVRDVTLKPGIRDLLFELHRESEIHLALCTGNIRRGAYEKLKKTDLDSLFPTGAFGDDADCRNLLPRIAFDRLQRYHLLRGFPESTIVVGDAPVDVRSAKHAGFRSVAVSTGFHSREELAAENPDLLLDSFSDSRPFRDFIRGRG